VADDDLAAPGQAAARYAQFTDSKTGARAQWPPA
jgi:hypothetical protein